MTHHIIQRPKSARLKHYDYSQPGGYFVTIVTVNRECLFGEIIDGVAVPSDFGRIIAEEWTRSGEIREELTIDEFIVMPNHLHDIVFIEDLSHCRARLRNDETNHRKPHSLGSFITGFKAYSTKRINELRGTAGERLWQPDYNEHVIRDDADLARIREYIANNPLKWHLDHENPLNINRNS